MKKMRLPKPVATGVVNRHLYLGSVYTAEQMHKFAEKAVLLEREACAKVCEDFYQGLPPKLTVRGYLEDMAKAIRARGQA